MALQARRFLREIELEVNLMQIGANARQQAPGADRREEIFA
jgi:hypothetical protein